MTERIYLSGPISGIKNNNREEFEKAQIKLEKEGFIVSNPLVICQSLGNDAPYGEYMCYDIRALTYCDSIYMLPGWKQSRGAMMEHMIALMIGLKVIDYGS
jgi:hypothetical protein